MRTVLYDDETMEALTVLELPSWAYDRLRDGERLRFPVYLRILGYVGPSDIRDVPEKAETPMVTVWFEKFMRNDQHHWFAFTNDGENALMLRAVFLPGQYKEIQKERQEAFMRGLLQALNR